MKFVEAGDYFYFRSVFAAEPLLAKCVKSLGRSILSIDYVHPDGRVVRNARIHEGEYLIAPTIDVLEAKLKGFDL